MENLDEVFDQTYTLKQANSASAKRYSDENSSDAELFFIMQDGMGALITFKKNGYREIHHLDDEGKSGYIRRDVKSPNPKFVQTVLTLVKKYITAGETVKILASEDMTKIYYRLAVAIWKRDKKFLLGAITKDKSSDRYSFVIHEQDQHFGYEKVGQYTLIEKTNYTYFNGELKL